MPMDPIPEDDGVVKASLKSPSTEKPPTTTSTMRRRTSTASQRRSAVQPGLFESLASLPPETRAAVPLVAGSTAAPGSVLSEWVSTRATSLAKADVLLGGEAQAPPQPKRVSAMALLSFSTTKEKMLMLLGTFSAGIAGLSMPVWLLLLAKSLDTFNNIGKLMNEVGGEAAINLLTDQLYQLCWSFAVVGFVSLLSGSLYVGLWSYTGERQALRIREQFVQAAFRQDAKWFDERGDPQELPTLATNALAKINDAIGRIMADTFANLLSSVCCLAVAIGLNASLALIMLCMLPVIAIIIAIISCFMRKRSGQALEVFASAGAFATEVLSGIKTIASLCAEKWSVDKYEQMSREAQKYSIWSGFLSKLTSGVMGLLFYITYTIAFLFGSEQVANTTATEESKLNPFYCMFNYCGISGSEVMVCIYGVILCAQFFALMSPGIQAVNLGRIAAVDIFGAISHDPDIDASSDTDGTKLESYDGNVELSHVAFAYPSRPGDLIFRDLSLTIKPGSAVALVGPSGSGKSTISKLLLRLYDPIGGKLLVDGVPLKELNLKWWRSQIGYVPQEPTLFIGSIRENIACGHPDGADAATEEEVFAAARAAAAHDFILEMPDGYETFYSGASIQMSGGQIQRIAIARALMRQPSILLLDEATSALDSESEKVVQDALENIRSQRKLTTITVAHRLTTIVNSDQIAVIAEGTIQELGTHKELIDEDGIYATLCESQGIGADAADTDTSGGVSNSNNGVDASLVSKKDVNIEKPKGNPDDVEAGFGPDDDKFKDEEDEGEEERLAPMSRLWEYNKSEKGFLAMGVIGALMVGVLPPAEGILFAQLTSNFFMLESGPMRAANQKLSLYFLALAAASLCGNLMMGAGFSVCGYRLTRRLRVLTFSNIMRHSIGWFDFPEHSTGVITERLEADAEAVNKVTGWNLGQQIQVFSSLAAGLIISLVFSWQIGLIAIGCVPLIMGASLLQAKCTKHRVVEIDGVSPATILERGLANIALVQAYGLQSKVSDQYSKALAPLAKDKVKQGFISGMVFGFSQFAIFCTFAVLFYAGIQFLLKQLLTFSQFFTALLAVMFSAFGVGQVNADFNSKRKGLAAAQRIFDIVDEPLDNEDPFKSDGTKPDSLTGNISFKACSFSYPTRPDHYIYYPSQGRDGFSLSIPSKESVAFVGRSGCGKSTALQILLRFYNVSSGSVELDDSNVQELNLSWLRGQIGYVGQQPVLFAGTVTENIKLGKPDASMEEIKQAAKMANAHDFITGLSEGYDTDIGPGGSLLSGGQKQRVAIARAIISDPQILVLDEATSALDNESERIVQAALDDMQKAKPRTTLVVAHRLQTIKNSNKIAVLDRGGVKELGSHSELLEKKGLYYDLWSKQGVKEE